MIQKLNTADFEVCCVGMIQKWSTSDIEMCCVGMIQKLNSVLCGYDTEVKH